MLRDEFRHAVMLVGLIAMMLLLFTTSYSDRAHRSSYAPRPSNGRSRESDDVFRSPSRVDFAPGRSTDRRPSSGYVELPQIPSSALESSVGPGRATDDRASPSNSRVESNDAKDAPRRSMCSTFCCHDFSDEVSQRPRGRWCCEPYHVDQRKGALEPRRT